MSTLLQQQLVVQGQAGTLYIEIEDAPGLGAAPAYDRFGGTRGVTDVAAESFQAGMSLIRQCAVAVVDSVSSIAAAARPSEVEVSFGVKFASEVGAFIAKTGTEGSLLVTLKWAGKKAE